MQISVLSQRFNAIVPLTGDCLIVCFYSGGVAVRTQATIKPCRVVYEQLAQRLAYRYQVSDFTSWCSLLTPLFFTATHTFCLQRHLTNTAQLQTVHPTTNNRSIICAKLSVGNLNNLNVGQYFRAC